MYALKAKPALSAGSGFTVAIATVHRPVPARFKRHFGILTALGTFYRKHLTPLSIARATVSVALCFPCLAARGTALGLIGVALRLEELLVLSAEGKGSPAIGTLDRLVLKTHWMTSSL
jgi:hypothetical protein